MPENTYKNTLNDFHQCDSLFGANSHVLPDKPRAEVLTLSTCIHIVVFFLQIHPP